VLQGVTGTIRHGSVTAVMGPSGAGKSTFVTTLCGKAYYGDVTGSVIINGVAEPFSK
jgi:ABC-type multidrug transport system ATPase subunit